MRAGMTTNEMIAVMQAYADGKEIEFRSAYTKEEYVKCFNATWNWAEFDYRIKHDPKPESEYVPYDNVKEVDRDRWVYNKNRRSLHRIGGIGCEDDNTILIIGDGWKSLDKLFRDYTYEDGSICGKKAEA